jgi:hypothetical protein
MREEMIRNYFQQLSFSLGGVRPLIGRDDLSTFYEEKDFVGMVRHVRTTLQLDVRIRLGLVNGGGPSHAPAWIALPKTMPPYGTRAFSRTVLTLYIRKSFLAAGPLERVVIALAHEFSHVVLAGIGHRLVAQEEAVDLAAMLLGYRGFYRSGSERTEVVVSSPRIGWLRSVFARLSSHYYVEERITTYRLGYLSLDEINYAAGIMDRQCREMTGEPR